MKFEVSYHPTVLKEDISALSVEMKRRIKKAIEERLTTDPHSYGHPLRRTLHGYWKLRVGDYRVVYQIDTAGVLIVAIKHRKEIYKIVGGRL